MVLAGGVGSRFWPVSTPSRPKQLLPLGSAAPLIHDTIERILPLVPPARLRILAGEALATPILDALPALGPDNLLCEPRARGTAPALAWAAAVIQRADPDAVMLSLHADHVIEPADAFRELLREAAIAAARHRRMFTIGAVPSRADTGYGYILPGEPLDNDGRAHAVRRFVEKPLLAVAETYVRDGYLWNTGIFALPVSVFLDEIARHTPELAVLLPLLERGDVGRFFEQAPELSVDVGILERSGRVGVMPATFRWDDVGSWDAVARTRPADDAGNVVVGDARLVESASCIAWAEEGTIVTFGVRDLVIVRAHGVTFVTPRDRAPELKRLLDKLTPDLRSPEGET